MARISERIVIPQETHILNGLNLQDCKFQLNNNTNVDFKVKVLNQHFFKVLKCKHDIILKTIVL
jgi:hypothetical protein